jgi:hypothetical protein
MADAGLAAPVRCHNWNEARNKKIVAIRDAIK